MKKNIIGKILGFLLLAFVILGCATSTSSDRTDTNGLNELLGLMSGSFSSQAQSEVDEDFYDIRLEMVPIWNDRTDGKWLYVEQASARALDKPYRQRIYHVTELSDGRYSSAVYSLPDDPLEFAGAWRNVSQFDSIKPSDLAIREGCAVILARQTNVSFSGSTIDKNCSSKLRGASYATSEVVVNKTGITSWDRGYDSDDAQVWGAEKGPYIFNRK